MIQKDRSLLQITKLSIGSKTTYRRTPWFPPKIQNPKLIYFLNQKSYKYVKTFSTEIFDNQHAELKNNNCKN